MTNKNTLYFQIIEKKDLKFYKPLGIIDPQPKTTLISISIFVSFGIPYLTFHKAVSRPNQMRTYIMVQIFRTLVLHFSSFYCTCQVTKCPSKGFTIQERNKNVMLRIQDKDFNLKNLKKAQFALIVQKKDNEILTTPFSNHKFYKI